MKVLIFMTQFYQLNGAEKLGVELAEELNKRGIHADIMSMYTEDLPGVAEAKQDLLRRGIPAIHFLGMHIHPSIASVFSSIRKLRRLIREHEYDIVETSTVSPTTLASWGTLGTTARHIAGLHHVFTREEHHSIPQKFWRFSVRRNPLIRYYAISNYVNQAWIRYSGTPPTHTRTIYNAIPDDCFEAVPERETVRAELGLPQDARIALYVGRLVAYKGADTLLLALGPILAQEQLFLLYVGQPDPSIDGTEDMLRQIKQQVAEATWGDRVMFLGYRKDVPRLMISSNILVHPARTEGFGLILAEAMATGLSVVASDVDGIPEVLKGTDSIMVPPNDPDSLQKAVLQILGRSPDEFAKAMKKGKERAEDFRIGKRVDAMVGLFEDVLGKRF